MRYPGSHLKALWLWCSSVSLWHVTYNNILLLSATQVYLPPLVICPWWILPSTLLLWTGYLPGNSATLVDSIYSQLIHTACNISVPGSPARQLNMKGKVLVHFFMGEVCSRVCYRLVTRAEQGLWAITCNYEHCLKITICHYALKTLLI